MRTSPPKVAPIWVWRRLEYDRLVVARVKGGPTVLAWFVPMLVICTLAAGATVPCGSKMVPAMPPQLVWAAAGSTAARTRSERANHRIVFTDQTSCASLLSITCTFRRQVSEFSENSLAEGGSH